MNRSKGNKENYERALVEDVAGKMYTADAKPPINENASKSKILDMIMGTEQSKVAIPNKSVKPFQINESINPTVFQQEQNIIKSPKFKIPSFRSDPYQRTSTSRAADKWLEDWFYNPETKEKFINYGGTEDEWQQIINSLENPIKSNYTWGKNQPGGVYIKSFDQASIPLDATVDIGVHEGIHKAKLLLNKNNPILHKLWNDFTDAVRLTPSEAYPEIFRFRQKLGLKPGQTIDLKTMEDNLHLISDGYSLPYKIKDKNKLLEIINKAPAIVPPAAIIGAGAMQNAQSKKQLKYKKGGSNLPSYQKKGQVTPTYSTPAELGRIEKMQPSSTRVAPPAPKIQASQYYAQAEKDVKNPNLIDEDFEKKYGTNKHTWQMKTDPKYRAQVEARAVESAKINGTVDYPSSSIYSKSYTGNPWLNFMVPAGLKGEARAAYEQSQMDIVGATLPIPGLQQMGKIPSIGTGLTKLGKVVDKIPNSNNVDELVDLWRIQERGARPMSELAAEGKLGPMFQNEKAIQHFKDREKYFGQWFTKDKADFDFYKADREFVDPEIIQLQVPKSKLAEFQNYDKSLSRAPDREFVIPLEQQKLFTPRTNSLNLERSIRDGSRKKSTLFKKRVDVDDANFKIDIGYRGRRESDKIIPKEINIKGKSGKWNISRNDDGTFSFHAAMSSPIESGKALKKLDELLPPKPVIHDQGRLSLDSYPLLLNMSRRSHWSSEFAGYTMLNKQHKHSNLFKGLEPEKSFLDMLESNTVYTFKDKPKANEAITRINELLKSKGFKEKAEVIENNETLGDLIKKTYSIKLPNYKFIRDYKQGGMYNSDTDEFLGFID